MSDILLEDLPAFLDGLAAVLETPRAEQPIRQTSEHIAGELGRGFQSSQSPSGVGWPALKRKRPKGHNPGLRPLIDMGEMMLSTISDGAGHVETTDGTSLEFGTTNWKAPFHQFGVPSKNIPARPFVGWTNGSSDYAANAVADHLVQRVETL